MIGNDNKCKSKKIVKLTCSRISLHYEEKVQSIISRLTLTVYNPLTISIRAIPSLTFGFVPSRVSSDKKLFVIQSFYDSSLKLISIILNKLLHLVIYWKSLIFGVFGSGADLEIFPIAWPRQTHFLVVLLYKFYRRPVIYSPTLHLI